MATVRKRKLPSGEIRWQVDYRDQGGKRRHKQFKTKAEAVSHETVIRGEIAAGVHTPASTSITIAAAGDMWIAQAIADGLEQSTVKQYREHLDLHIAHFIGKVKIAEFTPGDATTFRTTLQTAGRSAAMVKRVMVSLGAILADAMSRGKVARNVVREQRKNDRRTRRLEKRHKQRLVIGVDIPAKDEIRTLLDAATGSTRALVAVATFCGLRSSELRGLAWDAVDLKRAILTVRQRADRYNVIGMPKSDAAQREIPMSPIVVTALKAWKLACPNGELNLVFPNKKGGVMTHANIHRHVLGALHIKAGFTALDSIRAKHPDWKPWQVLEKAKEHPKYGQHSFRHACASLFIEQGYAPKRVQELMGHSTIQMTYDTYGHLFPAPADDQAMARAVQQAVFGATRRG